MHSPRSMPGWRDSEPLLTSPFPTQRSGSGRSTFDVVALLLLAPHHPAAPVLSHGTHQLPAAILPEQLLVLEGAKAREQRGREAGSARPGLSRRTGALRRRSSWRKGQKTGLE